VAYLQDSKSRAAEFEARTHHGTFAVRMAFTGWIQLSDGRLVSYALAPDAFEEDCRRASVVVATRDAPPANCAASVIGRSLWRDRGALALRRDGSGFVIESTRAVNFDRPWAPRQSRTSGTATPDDATNPSAISRAAPRDATPRAEDLEPGE
jgi:competence protein ComEC